MGNAAKFLICKVRKKRGAVPEGRAPVKLHGAATYGKADSFP